MTNDSQRLKSIRDKTGLSQAKFAELINFPVGKINHIENGTQKIPADLAQKLSKKFDYCFEWIMTGDGEMLIEEESISEDAVQFYMNLYELPREKAIKVVRLCRKNLEFVKQLAIHTRTDPQKAKEIIELALMLKD